MCPKNKPVRQLRFIGQRGLLILRVSNAYIPMSPKNKS